MHNKMMKADYITYTYEIFIYLHKEHTYMNKPKVVRPSETFIESCAILI